MHYARDATTERDVLTGLDWTMFKSGEDVAVQITVKLPCDACEFLQITWADDCPGAHP